MVTSCGKTPHAPSARATGFFNADLNLGINPSWNRGGEFERLPIGLSTTAVEIPSLMRETVLRRLSIPDSWLGLRVLLLAYYLPELAATSRTIPKRFWHEATGSKATA